MSTRGRQHSRRRALVTFLIAAIVVVAWWWLTTGSSTRAQADAVSASAESTLPAPTGASEVREVHSPKTVADDLPLAAGQCHVRVVDAAAGLTLPDRACTPGAVDPAVTQDNLDQTICTSGYTTTVRPSSSNTGKFKKESLSDYGLPADKTTEYDHLVSLQLGGSNAVSNLWPEPNKASATGTTNPKDAVENRLHKAICAREVTLVAAQQAIATDWTTAEQVLGIAK